MARIHADYNDEHYLRSDGNTREVRVYAMFTRFDEMTATVAPVDRDHDMFTVPVEALKNLRVVE